MMKEMRHHSSRLNVALVLALIPGAWGAQAWAQQAAADKSQQPLIVRSHIIAPRSAGAFRLKETSYRPEQKAAGALFRYASVPEPALTTDVFVFPAGRQPQREAIERGMLEFHAGLRAAQEANYFHDLKMVNEETFPLAVPDSKSGSNDPIAAAIAAEAPIGRRIDMTMDMGDARTPYRSRGYLFYKHLNFYKVRVSVPTEAMDAKDFAEFSDHAARTLVADIDTLNIGACADKTIFVDDKAKGQEAMLAMARQLAAFANENCKAEVSEGDLAKLTHGAETVTIEYSPNEWGGQ